MKTNENAIIELTIDLYRQDRATNVDMPSGAMLHFTSILRAVSNVAINGSVRATTLPSTDVVAHAPVQHGVNAMAATRRSVSVKEKRESVHSDHLVCLEDGTKHRMLKRYLSRAYGLTWSEYLQKHSLPADYPSVAPEYSAKKRDAAIKHKLGHHRNRAPRERV